MKTPLIALAVVSAFVAGQLSVSRSTHSVMPTLVNTGYAQFEEENKGFETFEISNDTIKQIRTANEGLQTAMESLRIEGKYEPATKSLNSFIVLSGGGNPLAQLEAGQGVDPETYAALYAGDAIPEVADYIAFDAEGRLTYKNQLVRIMPITDLKAAFATRKKLLTARLKTE